MTDRDEVERIAVEFGRGFARITKNHPNGDFVRFRDYEALRKQVADAVKMMSDQDFEYNRKTNALIARHAEQLTEARAQAAAAWEAGRDAAADMAAHGHHPRAIRALTPPADASAALTARLDAERRACATECEMCPEENWGQWMAVRIMARCSDKGGRP